MKSKLEKKREAFRRQIVEMFSEFGCNTLDLPPQAILALEAVVRGKKLLLVKRGPEICPCCNKFTVTVGVYPRTKKSLHKLYGL